MFVRIPTDLEQRVWILAGIAVSLPLPDAMLTLWLSEANLLFDTL